MRLPYLCLPLTICLMLTSCQSSAVETSSISMEEVSSSTSIEDSAFASQPASELPEDLDPIQAGSIDGQTYQNEVLGFSYTFPEGWHLFDADQALEIQLEKAQAAYGTTEELEQSIELGSLGYLLYAEAPVLQTENATTSDLTTSSSSEDTAEEMEDGQNSPANILVQIAPAVALQDMTPSTYLEELAHQTQETYENLGGRMEPSSVESYTVDGNEVAFLQSQITLEVSSDGVTLEDTTIYQGYSIFLAEDHLVISLLLAQNETSFTEGMEVLHNLSFF